MYISPYYIANLFWYPAFENLFSVLRRTSKNINNYLPDNDHLHHLILKNLNKDKSTYKTSNDEPTPIDCVIDILDKVPEDLWTKKNLKILFDNDDALYNPYGVIAINPVKFPHVEYKKSQIFIDCLNNFCDDKIISMKNSYY